MKLREEAEQLQNSGRHLYLSITAALLQHLDNKCIHTPLLLLVELLFAHDSRSCGSCWRRHEKVLQSGPRMRVFCGILAFYETVNRLACL